MPETLENAGILAIIRLEEETHVLDTAYALVAGGITALEVSLTTPNALATVGVLSSNLPTEVLVGAGTVLDEEKAREAIRVGASFGVTPALRPKVIQAFKREGLGVISGAMTPTEILNSHECGADMVKVFPARSLGGPDYVREVRAPLPNIKLVPTGGVSLESVELYARVGASLLGVGSSLVDTEIIERKGWRELESRAAAFIDAWGRVQREEVN